MSPDEIREVIPPQQKYHCAEELILLDISSFMKNRDQIMISNKIQYNTIQYNTDIYLLGRS